MFNPNKTGLQNMLIISKKYLPKTTIFSLKNKLNDSSQEVKNKELNVILSSMTKEKFANFIIVCLCLQKVNNFGNFFLKKLTSSMRIVEEREHSKE